MTPDTPGLPVEPLKRCPFCGGEAAPYRDAPDIARCGKCSAEADIADWNRRVPSSAVAPPPAPGGGPEDRLAPVTVNEAAVERSGATSRAPAGPDPVPPMSPEKRQRLEAAGWKVGDVEEFLADPVPEGRAHAQVERLAGLLREALDRHCTKRPEVSEPFKEGHRWPCWEVVDNDSDEFLGDIAADLAAAGVTLRDAAGQGTQAGEAKIAPNSVPNVDGVRRVSASPASPALPPSMEEVERLLGEYVVLAVEESHLFCAGGGTEHERVEEQAETARTALLSTIRRLAAPQGAGELDEEIAAIQASPEVREWFTMWEVANDTPGQRDKFLTVERALIRAILRAAEGRKE